MFETVFAHDDHRRAGLGRSIVEELWTKAQELDPDCNFAFAWATHLNIGEGREETRMISGAERVAYCQKSEDAAVAFFKAIGFRRIGSSKFFALAKDPNHPSRRLVAADDPIPPHHPWLECADLVFDQLSDTDTVSFFERGLLLHPFTDNYWNAEDDEGNTLLHTVARKSKPKALSWLLSKRNAPELLEIRNHAGETPLEALESRLESRRVKCEIMMRTIPISDEFAGYGKDSVQCLMMLRNSIAAEVVDISRITYGCACGECVAGFISPRMAFTLQCHAEVTFVAVGEDIDYYSGQEWYEVNRDILQHNSSELKSSLIADVTLRKGMTNLFLCIAKCVQAKKLPSTPNILLCLADTQAATAHVSEFLEVAGSVAPFVLHCFRHAIEEDIFLGDGGHEAIFEYDIAEPKPCRNDHEFVFVVAQYAKLEGVSL